MGCRDQEDQQTAVGIAGFLVFFLGGGTGFVYLFVLVCLLRYDTCSLIVVLKLSITISPVLYHKLAGFLDFGKITWAVRSGMKQLALYIFVQCNACSSKPHLTTITILPRGHTTNPRILELSPYSCCPWPWVLNVEALALHVHHSSSTSIKL